MAGAANYLPEVRAQYEALPYPPVDPADEHKRLRQTWLEDLPMINHYCFAGRQSFGQGFRALVAGGGTGDATIYLAEQLRHTDAQVVHLELSQASTAIAQERARIRGLGNIRWVQASLLDLPTLGLGVFDYIGCSGVLHHLADPDAGLRALRGVLAPGGAMGLMVYGRAARAGVYQMQALMRLVNEGEADMQRRIANTRDLMASLPASNWFKRGEDLFRDHQSGDAGIYDLLLHAQDRAYSVGELFDWIEGAPENGGHGLHLEMTDVQRGRVPYLPRIVLGHRPPAMAARLRALPRRRQYEIAELLGGTLITHSMYVTPDASHTAPYGDAQYIPFLFHEPLTGEVLAGIFGESRGRPFALQHAHTGVHVTVDPGRYAPQILRLVNGERSFGQIFDAFRAQWRGKAAPPDDATLFADFADSYEVLNALERMLLKHPSSIAPQP